MSNNDFAVKQTERDKIPNGRFVGDASDEVRRERFSPKDEEKMRKAMFFKGFIKATWLQFKQPLEHVEEDLSDSTVKGRLIEISALNFKLERN